MNHKFPKNALRIFSKKKVSHNGELKKDDVSSSSTPETKKFFHDVIYRTNIRGNYPLPSNKEEELSWITDPHYFLCHMWQGNFSSPINDQLKKGETSVLYIGSNSKSWLSDMQIDYPTASFTGIDVSSSIEMNKLEDLSYVDNSFHMVFVRIYENPFTDKEWEKFIKEVFRLTKHNGWIELMPADARCFNCGPSFQAWNEAMMNGLKLKNINSDVCENFHQFLINTNQTKSTAHHIAIGPIGSWGGKAGQLGNAYIKAISAKVKPEVMNHLNITEEKYDVLMTESENEFNTYRTYSFSHRFMTQKI